MKRSKSSPVKKKVGGYNDSGNTRKYSFSLPVHLSGLECGGVVHILQEKNIWDKLPTAVQNKLSGDSFFKGTDITKDDLDSIDDKTYAIISKLILARSG